MGTPETLQRPLHTGRSPRGDVRSVDIYHLQVTTSDSTQRTLRQGAPGQDQKESGSIKKLIELTDLWPRGTSHPFAGSGLPGRGDGGE